jgi:hypothetical protein
MKEIRRMVRAEILSYMAQQPLGLVAAALHELDPRLSKCPEF